MEGRSAEEIASWLTSAVARHAGVAESAVDAQRPFSDYGLRSADAVALAGELEGWLGTSVSPALLYDHGCVADLSLHLTTPRVVSTEPAARGRVSGDAWTEEPIAIVGMSCRLPGAPNLARFWQLLREGVDAIKEVPAERWSLSRHYDPELSHAEAMNTKWGGFLEDVSAFDCDYFGISPLEAESIDPQQRLLLELASEALDDAGADPAELRGSRAGVFVGISGNDYERRHRGRAVGADVFFATSNALSIAANRISYVFDLRGPSIAIDTACSSSLVAVHQACRSLHAGESSIAVVGGVNLVLCPDLTISFSHAGATSPDGRCRAFDAAANGIVRGEGGAVVVLKPLSRALADRDHIYATIRGSAVNQDGRTNGLSAPSGVAQRAVLREAYGLSGIAPEDVQYVEAHGTGTRLGDPIEAAALGDVLGRGRSLTARLAIGSVKSNIGHLEAAAGVVSLVKVALALDHRSLPPTLHFERPNPHVDLEALGLDVQKTLGAWPRGANGRIGGVSAFGFGGTNAHVVLKEGPSVRRGPVETKSPCVALLSAKTPEALRQYAEDLAQNVEEVSASSLLDVAYTLARRGQHSVRASVGYESRDELVQGLRALASSAELATPGSPIVFVFSGHGAHWWGMGRELCAAVPLFRERLTVCALALRQYSTWHVWEELQRSEETSRIGRDLELTQLATFAIQASLSDTWKALGLMPSAVVGHSLGEVAGAYAAEVLTLDEAARVVCARSYEMAVGLDTATPGAMAIVRLSPEEAAVALEGHESKVSLAAHNAPRSVVLSGERGALLQVVEALRERRTAVVLVDAPGAGHSPAVEPAVAPLVARLAGLRPSPGKVPLFSSVTGARVEGQQLDAEYWGRNLRQPVQFVAAVEAVCRELTRSTWLEINAQSLLSASIEQILRRANRRETVLGSLKREQEARVWFGALGGLHEAGGAVRASSLFGTLGGRLIGLPSYAWQRRRYWLPVADAVHALSPIEPARSFTGVSGRVDLPSPGRPALWQGLSLGEPARLATFELAGRRVAATSTLLDLVMNAHGEYCGEQLLELANVRAQRPVYLDEPSPPSLGLLLWEVAEGVTGFELFLRGPAARNETTASKVTVLTGEACSTPKDVAPTAEATRASPPMASLDAADVAVHLAKLGISCRELGFELEQLTCSPRRLTASYRLNPGRRPLSAAVCADLATHALLLLVPPRLLSGWQELRLIDSTRVVEGQVQVLVEEEDSEPNVEVRASDGRLLARFSALRGPNVDSPIAASSLPAVTTARAAAIEASVLARIAEVLGVPSSSLDAGEPLSHFGIDSMTALQLKNGLERDLAISLPLAKLLQGPTIRELSVWAAQSGRRHSDGAAAELSLETRAEVDLVLAGVEQLPADELDALLSSLMDEEASDARGDAHAALQTGAPSITAELD